MKQNFNLIRRFISSIKFQINAQHRIKKKAYASILEAANF